MGCDCSYPAVHNRADIDISSPMKIHGKKGSKGTFIREKEDVFGQGDGVLGEGECIRTEVESVC